MRVASVAGGGMVAGWGMGNWWAVQVREQVVGEWFLCEFLCVSPCMFVWSRQACCCAGVWVVVVVLGEGEGRLGVPSPVGTGFSEGGIQ